MKKIIILMLILGLGVIVNADYIPSWCYQEFANQTSSCGGLGTGLYKINGSWDDAYLVIDGNWTTYSNVSSIFSAELFINYTKHPDSVGALWLHKDNRILNTTIIADCWNAYNNTIRLMITKGFRDNYLDYWCYNGSDWYKLDSCVTEPMILYEEAIWWNTSYDTPNITIYSPPAQRYYTTSILVNWTASDSDGIAEMRWSNGTTNFTYTNPVWLNLTHGNYTFTFYAKDNDGYWNEKIVNFQVHAPETLPVYVEIHFLAILIFIALSFTYMVYSKNMEYLPIIHLITAILWIFIGLGVIKAIQYYFPQAYSFTIYTIAGFPYQYLSGFLISFIGIAMILELVIKTITQK